MLKLRVFLKNWLPILLWLLVITMASGDQKSVQHSSRLIGPLVHWLFPQLSPEAIKEVIYYVRKLAHLTEFAVLALLFWRALRPVTTCVPGVWSWSLAGKAWLCTLVWAAADELHQYFVPGRQAAVLDVVIDVTGAAIGLLLLRAVGRWRKLW